MATCPLCGQSADHAHVDGPDSRTYFLCDSCLLIYAAPSHHPSPEDERRRYLCHENDSDSPGYVKFLNKAVEPAMRLIRPGARGLDYGCGPSRTLAALLTEKGFPCDNYDPFFFPDAPPAERYDLIFATECLEHFFNPAREIARIVDLMSDGAILVVMTSLWRSLEEFRRWSYARDFTHVVFYHERTMDFIAQRHALDKVHDDGARVVIFRSRASSRK